MTFAERPHDCVACDQRPARPDGVVCRPCLVDEALIANYLRHYRGQR